MNDYLKSYKKYLSEKNVSERTADIYIRKATEFANYCDGKKIESASDIKSSTVNEYFDFVFDGSLSQATRNLTVSSIKSYLNFLVLRRHLKMDISQIQKVHAVKEKTPEVLTDREVNILCDFKKSDTVKWYRDSMMILLCFNSGISVSELCALNVSDINLSVGTVRIRGDVSRTVPINDITVKHLKTYIKSKRTSIVDNENQNALFLNLNGGRMSRQGFWKIVGERCEDVKFKRKITPKTLKYSYALKLVEDGVPSEQIMEIMGYDNEISLKKYSKLIKQKYSRKR